MDEPKTTSEETRSRLFAATKTRRQSRLYWRVWNHVKENGSTIEDEYQLILDKESKMPRALREYLKSVMEYEPTEADLKRAQEVESLLEAMQEEE